MTLDDHLSDIFNGLNKDIDKTLETVQKNGGELTVRPGGINNAKQCLKTIFGVRSQYFKGITAKDLADNEGFQAFYDSVKEQGYKLAISDIKDPVNLPKHLLTKSSLSFAAGVGLVRVGALPFVKVAGIALTVGGIGFTALRLSNIGKAKVTFEIFKP